jgi:hypothetical protein
LHEEAGPKILFGFDGFIDAAGEVFDQPEDSK